MGLPVDDLYGVNVLRDVTLTAVTNLLAISFTHLMISGELWGFMTGVSQWFHISEEDWKMLENEERKQDGRDPIP